VAETFRRRKDGEKWTLEMECNIDRSGSPKPRAAVKAPTSGDIIDLHSPAETLVRRNVHNQAELLRHAANATLDRRSLAIERKTSATCLTIAGSRSRNGRRTEPPSKPRRFIAALVVCG
jgi:hypothetical protein